MSASNSEPGSRCIGSSGDRRVLVLGIESSANKVGVGIVDGSGSILANPRETFVTPPGTGFLPRETANHHHKHIVRLVQDALSEAGVSPYEISAVAYTAGPGMGSPLSVGALAARTLSLLWGKPLIPVNHCIAHIEMGRLVTKCDDPTVLYVSGGNTQVIGYSAGRYRVLGETLDISAGNCIDRAARLLMLPNDPAPGYQVEALARRFEEKFRATRAENAREKGGEGDVCVASAAEAPAAPPLLPLGYNVKGMDVSFSGVLSKVEDFVQLMQQHQTPAPREEKPLHLENRMRRRQSGRESQAEGSSSLKASPSVEAAAAALRKAGVELKQVTPEWICYSLQETVFAMLVEITERAMALNNSADVLVGEMSFTAVAKPAAPLRCVALVSVQPAAWRSEAVRCFQVVGGVGCNERLQSMLRSMAERRLSRMGGMDARYCIDNGAMIAYVGVLMASRKDSQVSPLHSFYSQRFRTDAVEVTWRD